MDCPVHPLCWKEIVMSGAIKVRELHTLSRLYSSGGFVRRKSILAFVNDLDVVSVRIEHPCRIIAWIVFEPSLR
jgi:hypothetical protein